MATIEGFENCDSEHVFANLEKNIVSSEIRTLWGRLKDELERKDVGAATTYLDGEFQRIKESFARDIHHLEM